MADLNIDAVAKAAGVHRSTVSRAFSRPDAVKAQTREHILRVAEELGYTMSPLAQALRSKTSAFIPLIVPNLINPFYAELATTMTQTLSMVDPTGSASQADWHYWTELFQDEAGGVL